MNNKHCLLCLILLFIFTINLNAQELPLTLSSETHSSLISPSGKNISKSLLLQHIAFLSSDSLKGRRTGEPGNIIARNYIIDYLLAQNLNVTLQPFSFERNEKTYHATNIKAVIKGTKTPENYIAVTAHYDHLGIGRPIENDSIYNGADDNASGTAALMMMAAYFNENPPENSLVFIALDAEELGLQGAKYFVKNKGDKNIVLNINMDMISRNDNNEIYICGTRYTNSLKNYFKSIPQNIWPIKVSLGHDGLDGKDNWTTQSDHFHFYRNNIPFLYFGVEDHPDYHKPSDEFKNIDPDFYYNVVQFITNTIADLDSKIE